MQLASKWFSLGSDIRPVALIGAALALRGAASSQKQQQQPARTMISRSRGSLLRQEMAWENLEQVVGVPQEGHGGLEIFRDN